MQLHVFLVMFLPLFFPSQSLLSIASVVGSALRPVYARCMLSSGFKIIPLVVIFLSAFHPGCSSAEVNEETGDVLPSVEVTDTSCETDGDCSEGLCVEHQCIGNNNAPLANPGPDFLVATGTKTRVFGFDSDDLDGDPLTFDWSFEEQPEGADAEFDDPTVMTTWAMLEIPGIYTVRLVVHDGFVESEPSFLTIEVRDPDFWLNDCFTWPDEDFEQIFRNNIRFEKHHFDLSSDDFGHRLTVDNLVTEDIAETQNGFFGLGVPYFKWAESEGLVLTKLDLEESTMVFNPPLVVYPHGVFLEDTVVNRTLGVVENPSGMSTETVIRSHVLAIQKGPLQTTTADFAEATELSVAIETALDNVTPSRIWLSPGLGEVRIEHPKSDKEIPASMVELTWSSGTDTPPPDLTIPIPTMNAGLQADPEYWQSIAPMWHDLANDIWTPGDTLGIDLGAIRLAQDGARVWVRIEVSDPPLSTDASYSIDIAQTQPHGTAGDFTIYVQMQQDLGWYHAINQEASVGSPFSVDIVEQEIFTTDNSLYFALPLDMKGSESQPTLQEIVDGGYLRGSICLFKESHCSDQFISPIRLTLD